MSALRLVGHNPHPPPTGYRAATRPTRLPAPMAPPRAAYARCAQAQPGTPCAAFAERPLWAPRSPWKT